MLLITRRVGEKIMVGDDVVVHVMEIVGNTVRVGIQAPRSVPVYREEIWHAVRDENRAAADAAPFELPSPALKSYRSTDPGTVLAWTLPRPPEILPWRTLPWRSRVIASRAWSRAWSHRRSARRPRPS